MINEPRNNKRIVQQLSAALASGRSGHAFLFAGGSPESRMEIGSWLAEKVLCKDELSQQKFRHGNHEDFLLVEKPADKASIPVPLIEELTEKLAFKPFGECYAVLIKDAHLMRQEAQNKLLKTLEEPVTEAAIILLTERMDAILPTVRSRCNCYVLEEASANYSGEAMAAAAVMVNLIKGHAPYYKKKAALESILADKEQQRENALEFIDTLEEALEKELLGGGDIELIAQAIKQAETSRMYLKQVHNAAYTLKQLCLRV